MTHNGPSKANENNRENTMRSIILVAAILIVAFFIAPKVTALEIDNPFNQDDSTTYKVDFETPRITTVKVRGVEPTYDDFARWDRTWDRR